MNIVNSRANLTHPILRIGVNIGYYPLSMLFGCLLVICTSCDRTKAASQTSVVDPAKYYAVLLNNNSVYFGRLESLGSEYPVLRDVYYVQSSVNPETKAVTNILVRRGKEWHGPDRMIISQKAIVFIEPVGADSKVAQLIAESKK